MKSINAYLDAVQVKIYDIVQTFISTGVAFDGEKIKARYLGFDVKKPRMFLDVYEQHNKEFEALVGKGLSYRTLQKYKTIKAVWVAKTLLAPPSRCTTRGCSRSGILKPKSYPKSQIFLIGNI